LRSPRGDRDAARESASAFRRPSSQPRRAHSSQAGELETELERQLIAGDDGVDHRRQAELALGEGCIRLRRECLGEGLDVGRVDREAGGGAVAAEPRQVSAASDERAVEVERGQRSPRSLPLAVGAGDEHNRAVETLHEPRSDDPDDTFVPGLVGKDVTAARTPRLRPLVDLRDRLAQHPVLDRLALAVQLLQPAGELGGDLAVVGEK
jgi:hypothetical protein